MTSTVQIPTLDLAAPEPDLVKAFADAYSTVGFAMIKNHGIPPSLVAAVFDASRRFHDLPEAAKQAIALNKNHRGYIPINTSTDVNSNLAEVKKPNQSSSFMMMREDTTELDGVFLSGPNQWPQLPDFRAPLCDYTRQMSALGHRLVEIAARACSADPAEILPAFETPTIWLRLLHYPPTAPQSPADLYGSAPHTDFGALTLLAQDDVGGLQVQTTTGDWIDVPPTADTFIVNVGDMLHRLSNGFLKSTPHRVINTSGRERYSIPFFYDPHVNTIIKPLSGTGKPRFPALPFGDFLRSELTAGYDQHKSHQSTGFET